MKIKSYRIFYLIVLFLLICLNVFSLIYSFVYINKHDLDLTQSLMEIIAFAVLISLTLFEFYWICVSFKKGTQILSHLCYNSDKSVNHTILYISLISTITSFVLSLVFVLPLFTSLYKINNFTNITYLMMFDVFISLFINSGFVFLYTTLMRCEDLSIL